MHLFGGMIGWLLAAAVVLIPTFFFGRYAQTRPPLLTSSRAKSGFGGVLWLFLAGQIGWLLTLVWQTVYMTSELWFMLERNSQTMLAAFVAVVPGLVSICIGAWVIWQIAVKRSPNAVAFAVVGVWLMGPCAAMLQSWYFGLALTEMSLIQLFGWSIGWSLYFVLSPPAPGLPWPKASATQATRSISDIILFQNIVRNYKNSGEAQNSKP